VTEAVTAPAEEPRPFWKNPFVIGLAVGIAVLTILPILQRQSLRAPPPLGTLGKWEVPGVVMSDQLLGHVWILSVCPAPCDSDPLQPIVEHIEKTGIALVSAGGKGSTNIIPLHTLPFEEQLDRAAQAQPRLAHDPVPSTATSFVLIDQQGGIRGFWPKTDEGRGNVINAARLLSRYGPNP
jgi:hypothetical protein